MTRTILDFKTFPPTDPEHVSFSDYAMKEILGFEEILSGTAHAPADELTMQYNTGKRDQFYHLVGSRICSVVSADRDFAKEIFAKLVDDVSLEQHNNVPELALSNLWQGYNRYIRVFGGQDV